MAYTPYTLSCNGQRSMVREPGLSLIWTYVTLDAIGTVNTAGYFADVYHRGVRAGDIIHVITTSAGVPTAWNQCMVLGLTAGAANVSNGVSTALTDSD